MVRPPYSLYFTTAVGIALSVGHQVNIIDYLLSLESVPSQMLPFFEHNILFQAKQEIFFTAPNHYDCPLP